MNTLIALESLSALLTLIDQAGQTASRLSARLKEAHENPDDPAKQVTDEEVAEVRGQTDQMIADLKVKLAS